MGRGICGRCANTGENSIPSQVECKSPYADTSPPFKAGEGALEKDAAEAAAEADEAEDLSVAIRVDEALIALGETLPK